MKSYEPPLQIKISLPSEFKKRFGPESTGRYGGNLRVRCTNEEYDMMKAIAEKLNLSLAMFVRSCAVQTARILRDHETEQNNSMIAGEDDDAVRRNPKEGDKSVL